MIDIELVLHDIPDDQAGDLWAKLSIVASGFLADEHQVELATYRHDDFDEDDYLESAPDPSQENQP